MILKEDWETSNMYDGLSEELPILRLLFHNSFGSSGFKKRFDHEPDLSKNEELDVLERGFLLRHNRNLLLRFFKRFWELRHLLFTENILMEREDLIDICQLPEPMYSGQSLKKNESGETTLEIGSIITTPARNYGILVNRLENSSVYAVLIKRNHGLEFETVLLEEKALVIAQVQFATVDYKQEFFEPRPFPLDRY